MDIVQHSKQLVPAIAENAYRRLAGYRFAQRYIEGKSVAVICLEDVGYEANLLAGVAESVEGLTSSPEAVEQAQAFYPAPNTRYERANLPELPYSGEHFDVVVAFEVIETLDYPHDLISEAKRVLKKDGVLLLSTPNKQVYSNQRNHADPEHRREMYVPELREMLERSFEQVELYRQTAVAGALIFKDSANLSGGSIESARSSISEPAISEDSPEADFVVFVCSDSALAEGEDERPYLLLDRDRRLLEECADHREDIKLLRDEIRDMEQTEIQAFQDTLRFRNTELTHLRTKNKELQTHVQNIENSRAWQLLRAYRRLRAVAGRLKRLIR